MAWGFVQAPTAVGEVDGDGVLSLAFSGNTTQGNLIIVAFLYRDVFSGALSVDSVTDSQSNTYQSDHRTIVREDGTFYDYVELYSAPVTNAGATTVTVNISSGDPNTVVLAIAEYSGLNTGASRVDVESSAAGNSVAADSGSTGAIGAANELTFGVIGLTNAGGVSGLTASGYTERASVFSLFNYGLWIGDKDSGASGAQSIASTLADTSWWGAQAVVYKLAGEGNLSAFIGEPITGSSVLN